MKRHFNHSMLAFFQCFFLISSTPRRLNHYPIYQGHLLISKHPLPLFTGLCLPPHTWLSPFFGKCCFKGFLTFHNVFGKERGTFGVYLSGRNKPIRDPSEDRMRRLHLQMCFQKLHFHTRLCLMRAIALQRDNLEANLLLPGSHRPLPVLCHQK